MALGLTENCSITAGQPMPINSDDSSISAVASAGDPQVAQHRAGEEGHRADDRDGHQNQLGRQYRVDVGVTGTGEDLRAAVAGEQAAAVQPVADSLQ